MNSDYSNREIDRMFQEVHEKLDRILEQTTKTNGRVTAIEKWKWTIVGGGSVLIAINFPNITSLIGAI